MKTVQKRLKFEPLRRHGGQRKGSGRKRRGPKQVPHRRRPEVPGDKPVHLTFKVLEELPSLRHRDLLPAIDHCFAAAKERDGFRIVHWSMMSNHFHVIVEAACRTSMTSGVKGLKVRLARAINRFLSRTGRVFLGRCFEEVLTCVRQVRRCVRYVLENAKHHAANAIARGKLDPFSSACWFEGWKLPMARLRQIRHDRTRTVAPPTTRLLNVPIPLVPG